MYNRKSSIIILQGTGIVYHRASSILPGLQGSVLEGSVLQGRIIIITGQCITGQYITGSAV